MTYKSSLPSVNEYESVLVCSHWGVYLTITSLPGRAVPIILYKKQH